MPDTDSSSEESSTGMNSRFNNMAMPDTDSELSEEETPHAPIAPSRPNHQLNTLVMRILIPIPQTMVKMPLTPTMTRRVIQALLCQTPIVKAPVR